MGGPDMAPHTPQRSHAPRGTRGAARRQARTAYVFLAPGLLLFVVFRVYPLLEGLRLSFTNARLGRPSLAYVGAANYTRLLDDTRFHVSLANTAFYTIASTLPILVIPLGLALALNRGALRTVLRGVFFFPFTLSVVTVGLTWLWLLDPVVGPFNYYLRAAGVPARSWLADPSTAMWAIIATTVWWVTGYYLVIYLAGLQDIPRDLYEAAALDGAGSVRRFWAITLPLLRPVLLFVVRVFWVVVLPAKTAAVLVKVAPEWIPWPATGAHYHEVLLGSSRTARIGRAFANSIVVAVGTAVVVLVTSAMSAYALARLRFPGRGTVFTVLVGSLMIPNAVVLVPQYVLVQQLGWLSTFQGLIVPEAATTFAFGVFLLRQFFLTMPGELEDAARIDGANAWQVFTRIVLPLSQPVLAALGIFAFRSAWNDFLWPLIAVNKPDMFPLPVALALLRSAYSSESYGPIMAGAALSALPLFVVFLVANRRIVEGVRLSGLKG